MADEKNRILATQEELAKSVLEGFRLRYATLCDDWKNIEAKASNVITLAGIFFAGLFAVARATQEEFGLAETSFLLFSLCSIILAVGAAINVLRVRNVAAAPFGESLQKLVDDLGPTVREISDDEKICFLNDQIRLWRAAVDGIFEVNESKAKSLFWAQIFVAMGMVAFVVAAFVKICW